MAAPNKILTILGDQPIGSVQGDHVYPAMSFVQMLQRIVSYIGQPGGTSGSATTGTASGSSSSTVPMSAMTLSQSVAIATDYVTQQGPAIALSLDDIQTLAYVAAFSGADVAPSGSTFSGGAVYAPLVNGDPPGSVLPGYPDGQIKGPTFMADPWGQAILVQVR